ncbi:transcription antitermination factor NusB [Patescibacteria group bacterium]|nr:transcription antitermination factor NusB [Patescibacteria group bacterium]
MANRQLFRTVLIQTLYEWDIRGYQNAGLESYLDYVARSFNEAPDEESMNQAREVVVGIGKKRAIIDEVIEKAAPDWPLDKISVTDRNVLRLGLYELLFGDHDAVPPKVAINEAVELAKRFGGPKSNRFVNGILGAVYREIGEPGKDQVTKKKMPEVAYEEMPVDQKGSAVVFSIDDNGVVRIGMVHDVFGYWTLSKGTIEEGEDIAEGTVRIFKDKTGWLINIIASLGSNEYVAYHPERGPVRKNVQYFLARSEYTQPKLEEDPGGVDDIRWFELDEVSDLNIYEDVSQMLIASIGMIADLTKGTLATPDFSAEEPEEKALTAPTSTNTPDLSKMKLPELKALAKERGLKGFSTLKKAELIDLLSS